MKISYYRRSSAETFTAMDNDRIPTTKYHIGGVAKRPKATVCKTVIRRFESDRRLFLSGNIIISQNKKSVAAVKTATLKNLTISNQYNLILLVRL